jgi:hypothetical protein
VGAAAPVRMNAEKPGREAGAAPPPSSPAPPLLSSSSGRQRSSECDNRGTTRCVYQ